MHGLNLCYRADQENQPDADHRSDDYATDLAESAAERLVSETNKDQRTANDHRDIHALCSDGTNVTFWTNTRPRSGDGALGNQERLGKHANIAIY